MLQFEDTEQALDPSMAEIMKLPDREFKTTVNGEEL